MTWVKRTDPLAGQPAAATAIPKAIRIGILVALAVFTLVLGLQARHKVIVNMPKQRHIDAFDSYMKIIPQYLYQHKPYTSERFPLPPFAMLFLAPCTLLSRPNAQMAWVFCKPFMFVPIFLLALSIVRRGGGNIPLGVLAVVAAGWFFPLIGDIQEGQMNLLMLLPLTIALWMAQEESPRGDLASGLMLAMAICIKVTPLAFVAYFLFRRRWAIAAWTLAGIGLWLVVVPALFFGWRQNLLWLDQWSRLMIFPYVMHDTIKFPNGESIPEFLLRLLSHLPAWKTNRAGVVHNHYINVVNLSPALAHLISRVVLLAIAIAGMVWARLSLATFRTRRYVMEIACIGVFMLWASERTWVPHYVTLIFALMAAAMILCDERATHPARWRAGLALLATALFMPWTSELAKIFGPNGRHYVDTIDLVLWLSMALMIAIITARFEPGVEYADARFISSKPHDKIDS